MKAKVTISKMGMTAREGNFAIEIKDASSGLMITRLKMPLIEFAECIGGLGNCEAEIDMIATEYGFSRFGKKRETKSLFCARLPNKEAQAELVDTLIPAGWELWDNGTRRRQDGQDHRFIVCRYVDE